MGANKPTSSIYLRDIESEARGKGKEGGEMFDWRESTRDMGRRRATLLLS